MEKERNTISSTLNPRPRANRSTIPQPACWRLLGGSFLVVEHTRLSPTGATSATLRVRGALASLRSDHGDDATLLLVVHQPHAAAMVKALDANRTVEEISSTATASTHTEEE